jgi:hypothetical protein
MVLAVAAIGFGVAGGTSSAQASRTDGAAFHIGERLTYNVSMGRFRNVAYAEFYAKSQGRLAQTDAVELFARVRTLDFVSAAYYPVDRSRTTFAAADSGLPLYIVDRDNLGGVPKETVVNYLTAPTQNFDLLTLLYKIRRSAGTGAATLSEKGTSYGATFQVTGSERVTSDAGEFETMIVSCQSEYLADIGLRDLTLNLTSDAARVPVQIKFKTDKGEFRALIASIQQIDDPNKEQLPPVAVETPRPTPAPRPIATPTPYIEDQALSGDLAFTLGETLEYSVSASGRKLATVVTKAAARKEVGGIDTLLLRATVTAVEPGNPLFVPGDIIEAQVHPETLAPYRFASLFKGPLSSLTESVIFDLRGTATTSKNNRVDVPIGTHCILSLIYAVRSFNLKPSKDPNNPVNDTRVAVFWEERPYVFTLRPSETADVLTLGGEKIPSQLISIATGNPRLDALGLKIWLSNDGRRLPLRISAGDYQADLVQLPKTENR